VTSAVLDDSTAGTIGLGDELRVRRLGLGAMRVSGARNGDGVRDRNEAIRLYRRAFDRGVNFFDLANIYGFGEVEEILPEALYPYPEDLVIATKAGFTPTKLAPGARSLPPKGDPEHIREECLKSLKRLRVECIDLYQVHVPDPDVPYAETVGAFAELQREGKIREIGISNVSMEHLGIAQGVCRVVSVQNFYSVGHRRSEQVLQTCEEQGIAFIPHSPNQVSGTQAEPVIQDIAGSHGVSMQQVAVAWLLEHSPAMLPIPGTSKIDHLDDNIDAAWLHLTPAEASQLAGSLDRRDS
jgi:pyridoxine 4-dehydrogenase